MTPGTVVITSLLARDKPLGAPASVKRVYLVVLAWTDDELSRRQAQNGVNFEFEGKFDLEGKG